MHRLELLHGGNVDRLNVVLVLLDLLSELVHRDLGVLNNAVDLELLDTVTDSNELVTTPVETVHLDLLDVGKHLLEVSLVIPRLDVEGDNRLGGRARTLGSLLGTVLSKTLLLQLLGLLIDLVVRAKEVDVVVVLSGGRSGGSLRAVGRGLLLVARERRELRLVRSNVLVPAGSVGVLLSIGGGANSLEDGNIGLRGGSAVVSLQIGKEKKKKV